jgi:ketosteroid isomerase-like protein
MVQEDTIYGYFRLIKNKDINRLLDLFTDDAIIYEPFSNIQGGLRGKSAIKPFLEIALMANDGLQHKIEIEQKKQQQRQSNTGKEDKVTALVTFQRGGMVQVRFTFQLEEAVEHTMNKIRSLHIEFIK